MATGSADGGPDAPPRRTDGEEYTVRPFEAGDRAGFLDLFRTVFGERADAAWFDWKYVDNPYAEAVTIIVAEHDGRLVGVKAGMPFRLRDGRTGETVPALQPADTMVHPDHRRQGLYSRLTELMKRRYADRAPALFFNFPNPATLAGSLKHGWTEVGAVPTYYRVQDPAALPGEPPLGHFGRSGAAAGMRAYLRARRTLAPAPTSAVTVERYAEPRPALLAEVADRAPPTGLGAPRDTAFYRWRLANPNWSYGTYVARRDGDPVAAVVVGTRRGTRGRTRRLAELLPLDGTARDPFRAIVGRVLADHADAGLLAASGTRLPARVLREQGFLPDTALPLSAVARPTRLVTYPLDDRFADGDLTDPTALGNWAITRLEQDTG